MNLRGIDLNLLVVLDALLDEAHVSRAAERVGLSQPAASSARAMPGSRAAMAARVRRTFHTCRLHWARQGPGERLLCSLTRGRIFHDSTASTVE